MSIPIALGRSNGLPPSPPGNDRDLTSISTPDRRLPRVDRSTADPQNVKAAEGMETMFLDFMLQKMRETVPENEFDLESPATKIYRGMMDSETAKTAAHSGGIGLADTIIAYLESQRYNSRQGQGVPQAVNDPTGGKNIRRTGGSHEGQ